MTFFRRHKADRKPQVSKRHTLAPESLEQRRLMAADAFNFESLEDPTVVAIRTEMYQTVDELAAMVQRNSNPEHFQMALEVGDPQLLLAEIGPEKFQPIVDASDIPGLGQAIGQAPQLGQSLTDMVIMDLMGVPEQAPEYSQQMNFFLNELDCQLDLFIDISVGTTRDELSPQFEQLRLEMGDEAFAEWLRSNQEQTGTLSGITGNSIEELDAYAIQQLDQQEAELDRWLRTFTESTVKLELPETFETLRVELGDEWFDFWLDHNAQLFGNLSGLPEQVVFKLEVDDPGLQTFHRQEQALEAWLVDVGNQLTLPTDVTPIDVEVPGHFQDQLPPQLEQMRLTMGNEAFAEWLEANREQFGNLLGVQDPAWITDEVADQETILKDWLDSHRFEPPIFELAGDTDGDGTVAFNDFLTLSSNFGTVVNLGYLAGDFDLDGTVAFSDFLVLSSNFGTTTINCGCDTSDANDPKDGTEIQDAGELEIREGSIVFVSDKTVDGDAENLKDDAPAGTPIHTGMSSWQDIIDKIKDKPDGSITGDLVISGHGADGGVDASKSDIDGEDLTAEQAAILKKKLGKGARIVVLGCCQANKQENDHMQRLADLTGVPVVGNQGSVNNGANGGDDWFRFDPKPAPKK